ncbi:MAG: VanZ family protein [Pseudomonadota bacterium]|jgi:Glycopeptide antibiotics resistance protein|nr:MAG: hypothetical protein DIU56_04835 [Pseudomonadota bacterium]
MTQSAAAASERALRRTAAWLLLFTVLFMVYASLYPFEFDLERLRAAGRGEWLHGMAWRRPVRNDVIANLLFYLPFGALLTYLTPRRWGALRRILFVIACGAALSCTIEFAQFATRDRVPSLADLVVNTASAGLAALAVIAFDGLGLRPALPQLRGQRPDLVALLLVIAWVSFHAAPFMPTSRFVRFFQDPALLLEHPGSLAALAAYFSGYLMLGAALRTLLRPDSFWPVFGGFAAFSLLSRIGFRGQYLELAECAALVIALPVIWWFVNSNERRALPAAAWLVAIGLLIHGITPLDFAAEAPRFAGIETLRIASRGTGDELGLLETAYLYGGLVWLAVEAGVPLRRITPFLLAGAAGIEIAQAWQAERAAHLAGPLAVLLGAALVKLRGSRRQSRSEPQSAPRFARRGLP